MMFKEVLFDDFESMLLQKLINFTYIFLDKTSQKTLIVHAFKFIVNFIFNVHP